MVDVRRPHNLFAVEAKAIALQILWDLGNYYPLLVR